MNSRNPNDSHAPTPYTFVPVKLATDETNASTAALGERFEVPGHDGAGTSDAQERLSGELRLTLTAHTPLLVGAHRKDHQEGGSLLEPWRLDDEHQRVVLAGSSLKGMIRHYLSALLNAPMERVAEQLFSYRPNLDIGKQSKLQVLPAQVIRPPNADGTGMQVALFTSTTDIYFVRKSVAEQLRITHGSTVSPGTYRDIKLDARNHRNRLETSAGGTWTNNQTLTVLEYFGGLTGDAKHEGSSLFTKWHKSANKCPETKLYSMLLAPAPGRTCDVDASVVAAYVHTQDDLSNTKHGHCSSRHPLVEKGDANLASASFDDARACRLLGVGTLIFVEVDCDTRQVVSFGHNFRYRWLYRDTVRRLAASTDNERIRPELDFTADAEQLRLAGESRPKLTAARALFGYVADKNMHGKNNVIEGDHSRLAGRIAINHALETLESAQRRPSERFVNDHGSTELRLTELGTPKASAVEFYVQQSDKDNKVGRLTTYGDLADSPDSQLAGRKFYRNQPPAAEPGHRDSIESKATTDSDISRTTAIRNASTPGSTFKFTLRFRDLSRVELGALLFVLGIHRADAFRGKGAEPANTDLPAYALKLGYARPLGWGSVTIDLDGVSLLLVDDDDGPHAQLTVPGNGKAQWERALVKEFIDRSAILSPAFDVCLDAWSFANRGEAKYPERTVIDKNNNAETTIYNFHTDLRRRHSKARRSGGSAITETNWVKPEFGSKDRTR